jgi:hypothetical protein
MCRLPIKGRRKVVGVYLGILFAIGGLGALFVFVAAS